MLKNASDLHGSGVEATQREDQQRSLSDMNHDKAQNLKSGRSSKGFMAVRSKIPERKNESKMLISWAHFAFGDKEPREKNADSGGCQYRQPSYLGVIINDCISDSFCVIGMSDP